MTERTYALSPDCGEKFYNQADYDLFVARYGDMSRLQGMGALPATDPND